MKGDKIRYRAGYKYQLADDYQVVIDIRPVEFILTSYIRLDVDGMLSIKNGYCWDGPSGPTVDTKNFMRGSLVHDALYQLLRAGRLAPQLRTAADGELRKICLQDGMSAVRTAWVYAGVRCGGEAAIRPTTDKDGWNDTVEAP